MHVLCFYSFWVAWQYPWGSFCVFCSPICHRCFCILASLLSSLNLGPGESCAVAVNAGAIAQRPRKFIKGFSSSSLSSFWSELLAFSNRCPPQANRRRQKTPVTKTKNVLFWDFSIGTIFGNFLHKHNNQERDYDPTRVKCIL